ncbi:MAG: rhomboid family intramembrane serine protease [Pirellulaceae bacterium]|jgi:GlpG protein|nr:rhomboid family intramembrane serine protease [Pirellulaceae bacterium]
MRQIGTLQTQAQADRFTAFLITQGISAVVEPEANWWAVWVRDEDRVVAARDALEEFRRNPDDARYRGVMREASAVLQEEAKRRELARKNVITMAARGGPPGVRAAPLTAVIIGLCVVLFVMSGWGRKAASGPVRALLFCDVRHSRDSDWDETRLADRLIDIRQGQWWRLVTPIFLHGDLLHLLFNMIMFHLFARPIEMRKGAGALALMILLIALASNTAQGLAPSTWGPLSGGPSFLGISGVVYGLMGYLWMKTVYDPGSGLYVNPGTVVFLLGWMTLGLTGVFQDTMPMANLAHLCGLLSGMVLGYVTSPRS